MVVVSPDPAALQLAIADGAVPLTQTGTGLNEALRTAEAWAGDADATALLVLPADLPNIGPAELEAFLTEVRQQADVHGARATSAGAGAGTTSRVADQMNDSDVTPVSGTGSSHDGLDGNTPSGAPSPGDGLVGLVSDRHNEGTNLLFVAPPGLISFAFGPGSRRAHEAAAEQAGARFIELGGPLAIDLDTPEDLLLVDVEQIAHEGRPLVEDRPAPPPAGLEILPLAGLPEVVRRRRPAGAPRDGPGRHAGRPAPARDGRPGGAPRRSSRRPRARSST